MTAAAVTAGLAAAVTAVIAVLAAAAAALPRRGPPAAPHRDHLPLPYLQAAVAPPSASAHVVNSNERAQNQNSAWERPSGGVE